jgi:tetratricopeptide (TPR) repeat protein
MRSWLKLITPLTLLTGMGALSLIPSLAQAQEMDFGEDDGPPPAEVEIPVDEEASEPEDNEASLTPAFVFALTDEASLEGMVNEIDSALRDTLGLSEHFSITGADNRLNGVDEDAVDALRGARDLFESARISYESLEIDTAIEQFEQALEIYEDNIAHVSDITLISDCLLYVGAAQLLQGASRTARSTIQQMLVIDPARRPDPDLFPPSVTEAFEAEAGRVDRLREGRLDVTSDPPGADVYVDGIYQGPAPVELPGLKTGRHYVRVRAQGYVEAGQVVDIGFRRPTSVELSLERTVDGVAVADMLREIADQLGRSPREAGLTIQSLGQMLEVEVLATAFISQGDDGIMVRLESWNVAEGSTVQSETVGPFEASGVVVAGSVQPPFEELLRATWTSMNVRQTDDEPIVEQQPPPPPPPPPPRPVWRQWWFWTVIGAVVVGAGVGLGVGLGTANQEPGLTNGEVIIDL